jgi:hypothetical protein
MDPPEDRQHHQVRLAAIASPFDNTANFWNAAEIITEFWADTTSTGTTPSADTGARPASVSKRIALTHHPSLDSRFPSSLQPARDKPSLRMSDHGNCAHGENRALSLLSGQTRDAMEAFSLRLLGYYLSLMALGVLRIGKDHDGLD